LIEATLYLKRPLRKLPPGKHPWIFSNAIESVEGCPEPGEVVRVIDSEGLFIARGYYNAKSRIAVRLLEWNEEKSINESWWREKLSRSIQRRQQYPGLAECNAYRLCHAEADGLPGLIVDRYGDFVVLQCLTAGMEKVRDIISDEIYASLHPQGIFERSDASVRSLEGLEQRCGSLKGKTPPEQVEIYEGHCRYFVDIRNGQKTGFFLDQRENRRRVASHLASRVVLDCFCYSGGFSIRGLMGGALSCILLDSSRIALDLARQNLKRNDLPQQEFVQGDAFRQLREFKLKGLRFDAIVLDPPKLAPTRFHAPKAMRAYKDINLMAMLLLRSEGILATFSCSSGISAEMFQEICLWASIDAQREVHILEQLSQTEDHPVRLGFPESSYLKGLICRVH